MKSLYNLKVINIKTYKIMKTSQNQTIGYQKGRSSTTQKKQGSIKRNQKEPIQYKGEIHLKKQIKDRESQKTQHEKKYVLQPIVTVNGEKIMKQYDKIKKIGQGSYSKVFLVKTTNSDSTYAIKIIPKKKLQILIKQKLIYQIKIQQQLSHPNVVYLDHWFQDQSFQYIFMEYCQNGNLQKKLQQAGHFSQDQIRKYILQIVESLVYIHSKNILHRDLKLCNFYLDKDDNIKLGDFGFACQLSHSGQLKRQTCGTPNYIAPESISGYGYSFSSDVWAVGVILFRMLYNECPFQGPNVKLTLQNVKLCRYQFPKTKKISKELKDLITKIFTINYDDRLTLEQIKSHPFLYDFVNEHNQKGLKKQKKGFSLSKLFSRQKKQQKSPKNSRPSRMSSKQQPAPLRSNSCETFKHIKETFKTKTVGNNTVNTMNTLATNPDLYPIMKTQTNTSVLNSLNGTMSLREGASKTMRQIIDSNYTNAFSINDKQKQGRSRLSDFIKSQSNTINIKDKQKMIGINKGQVTEKHKILQHLLNNCQKKYYLPQFYQYEKDITIVQFKKSIKLIIYPSQITSCLTNPNCVLIHRDKSSIYQLSGKEVLYQKLPKVLRYVIEKKVQISPAQDFQQQEGFVTTQSVLLKISHQVLTHKDGIVLKYGLQDKGYFVGKTNSQQFMYLGSLQQRKMSTLFSFNSVKNKHQTQDGPVLIKIYSGWISSMLNKQNKK